MAEYEEFWKNEYESLGCESKDLIKESPEAKDVIQRVLKTLSDIVSLASCTPKEVGHSDEWAQIADTAQEDRANLCQILKGKRLFSALYGVYCLTLANLKAVLQNSVGRTVSPPTNTTEKPSTETSADDIEGFQDRKRKKRTSTGEKLPSKTQPATSIPTRNFFAPLNSQSMDTGDKEEEETQKRKGTGRAPPIIVTSNINLIKTQKELDTQLLGTFTNRNTRNGTRFTTKSMEDYTTLKTHLENTKRNYYTFHPKDEKPIKAVIRHLPIDTLAEDIANELLAMDYKVHNVKQMSTTRQQPEGGRLTQAKPLFITLERSEKSEEIFKLTQLHHIIIQVEAYRARTGLTQCFNCQQFGHVWANCKQPPRCLWCGGHRHKKCPEKEKDSSPNCCNCKLAEGEAPHPANYRGCKLAKE